MVSYVLSHPCLFLASNSINVLGNYILQIGLIEQHCEVILYATERNMRTLLRSAPASINRTAACA